MSQNMSDKEPWGDNFSDQSFEFKDEFWEEAEELLVKDRKTSVLKKSSMVLATLFFIGLWAWWATDHQGMFINNNSDLNESMTYIDTADQLSPEKFRIEYPQITPVNQKDSENDELDEILTSNKSTSTPKIKRQQIKKPINSKSKTMIFNTDEDLAVINKSQDKTLSAEEMTEIKSLMPGVIQSNQFNKNIESNTIEIETGKDRLPPVVKRSRFNILAGTGVNLITNTTVNNFTQNFNISANYAFLRREKISLEAGIGFKSMQLHGIDTSFVNKTYGFGSKQRIMDVNYKNNYYVYAPLKLTYHHKNHQLTAGINVGYLAATETSLETRKIEYKSNENTLENKIDRNFGIDEGVQKVLLETSVGYSYQVSPKIDLGVQVDFSVNDITENQFWNSNINNRSLSGVVQLKYHFPTIMRK